MRARGNNKYKLGHMLKAKLTKEGKLSLNLLCSPSVLQIEPSVNTNKPKITAIETPVTPPVVAQSPSQLKESVCANA